MSKARETANITTSDQTIAGVKTFSDKPQIPNATTGTDAVNFSQVIGIGQTWQNVIASRSAGVTYTNTTGKPILVSVITTNNSNEKYLNLNINTMGAGKIGNGGWNTSSISNDIKWLIIVPPNDTYSASLTGASISDWHEYR
jgi:hypothetical protein